MFCDRCGTQLGSGAQFCTSCGKAVIPVAPPGAAFGPTPPSPGRVRRHIHRLATPWVVNGVLRLVGVAWFMHFGRMFFSGFRGWMGPVVWPFGRGWGFGAGGLFSPGAFLGFFGVLHLVLAWGLFERQPWARMLGLVLGILALLRFPFGTALGIYTLWVLAPEPCEYHQLSRPAGQINDARFSLSGPR